MFARTIFSTEPFGFLKSRRRRATARTRLLFEVVSSPFPTLPSPSAYRSCAQFRLNPMQCIAGTILAKTTKERRPIPGKRFSVQPRQISCRSSYSWRLAPLFHFPESATRRLITQTVVIAFFRRFLLFTSYLTSLQGN